MYQWYVFKSQRNLIFSSGFEVIKESQWHNGLLVTVSHTDRPFLLYVYSFYIFT